MKINTIIGNERLIISEPQISDVYIIEQDEVSKLFYIWSENGYNTQGILEFKDLDKAIAKVKSVIKNYFLDRGEENPKGW